MAFRASHFLAAGVFFGVGVLVALACNTPPDDQFGNVGQLCFEAPDGGMCDPGLTCVPFPLEGGGFDGGECFPIDAGDGGDGATSSEEDAPDAEEDVVGTDASDASADAQDAAEQDAEDEGDATLDSGGEDAASDAPVDAPEDASGSEASTDAKAE